MRMVKGGSKDGIPDQDVEEGKEEENDHSLAAAVTLVDVFLIKVIKILRQTTSSCK